jgi:hypothetical protein
MTAYESIVNQIASGTLKNAYQRFQTRPATPEKGEVPVSNVPPVSEPEVRAAKEAMRAAHDRMRAKGLLTFFPEEAIESMQPVERPGTSMQPVERPGISMQPVERPGISMQPVERPGISMQPEDLFGESSMEELSEDEKEKKKLIDAIMKISSKTSLAKPSASAKK